jgi:hypothetical protein
LPSATITSGGATTVCQGDSVVLNANTGNGLTYQWKNNGTNITGATTASYTATSAGSYTVVVTNSNNCSATSTATTITINPSTIPTFNQIAPICSGGTLTALPTTSNNGITGSWSPALNNTTTTTYTFTPTSTAAPTCATTATMTISVNQLTNPTFTQVAPICSGESLNNLPTVSDNNISGTWSPALNNMVTTTYTFTPNVGQCANTTSMTVQVNQPATPTFTQIAPICSGGTLSALPTTSNNNISGTWSPAINNTATTTYTFTPNTGQCASNQTMSVVVNPLPNVTLSAFNSLCDTAGNVTLTGGSPTGGTYSGTSVTNNTFNAAIGVGTYPITYSYTDNNGCSSTAIQNLTVIDCSGSGIVEINESGIILYPNPASKSFTIESTENNIGKLFEIHDVSGRIILSDKLESYKTQVIVSDFATGTYYLKFPELEKVIKFVKQ